MPHKVPLISSGELVQSARNNFEDTAFRIFRLQYEQCDIYRRFCDAIRARPEVVSQLSQIPFLPISFFRSHNVLTGNLVQPELVFESSGTTGQNTSRHLIADASVYKAALVEGFEEVYGPVKDYTILALLPSYLERGNSSLVYMARTLMEISGRSANGFFINEWEQLAAVIRQLEATGQKALLLGVTFALWDFADQYPMELRSTIVMETGGMKGRKSELTRTEVHEHLKACWRLENVHSEYGMTELLSQAYAPSEGRYHSSPTMRAFVRDLNDPLEVNVSGQGSLNIIDLANVHSCSFIATEDVGTIYTDGSFEVLGRMDHSILRGCSMLSA